MRKALWALAVLAAVALGTSVITAIVAGSAHARESRQIATLEHEQTVDQKEITALTGELHAAKASARSMRAPQMGPKADVRQASLLYSGLPWRHVP